MRTESLVVLMAEDSEHDIRAVQRIWKKKGIRNPLRIVKDGEECMEYLLREGRYSDPESSPRPGVLLLDINLPRMNGFEVLRQIKQTPILKRLPVVILTTSSEQEDMALSYDLGANAFLTKPLGMDNLGSILVAFNLFWELVRLPESQDNG